MFYISIHSICVSKRGREKCVCVCMCVCVCVCVSGINSFSVYVINLAGFFFCLWSHGTLPCRLDSIPVALSIYPPPPPPLPPPLSLSLSLSHSVSLSLSLSLF